MNSINIFFFSETEKDEVLLKLEEKLDFPSEKILLSKDTDKNEENIDSDMQNKDNLPNFEEKEPMLEEIEPKLPNEIFQSKNIPITLEEDLVDSDYTDLPNNEEISNNYNTGDVLKCYCIEERQCKHQTEILDTSHCPANLMQCCGLESPGKKLFLFKKKFASLNMNVLIFQNRINN